MEKQRIKGLIKSGRRFLISLLLLSIAGHAFSQNLTLSQIKQLRIVPEEGQNLYTKTDIKFIVTIPTVNPSQVQVLAANQQQDITFRSMRKSESYEPKGTLIELWYTFDNKGNFSLTPLSVMIQGHRRTINFDPVSVTDDPATMTPRIVLVFEDGTKIYSDDVNYPQPLLSVKTGKKLKFTVNIQYATQLVHFNWEIPKDSIFTCTRQYEFTEVRYRERVYSHTLIPVASFEWTGLIPGPQSLPKIRLNAAGYNGYRSELLFPEVIIEFTENTDSENTDTSSDIFANAFFQEKKSEESETIIPFTKEECIELADLYSKEHNAFLTYFKARGRRITFEESRGLVVSANQIFPALFMYISIIVILASITCIIILIKKKFRIRALMFVILLILGTAILIFCIVKRSESYGIADNCKIYSIPQENAESVSEVAGGSRVRILERTGKWYYIEIGETGGWCASDKIFIIR